MAMQKQVAFVTGGAAGIGKALSQMLVRKNISVFIADFDLKGAQHLVEELKSSSGDPRAASCAHADVSNWDSLAAAFTQAITEFGRMDYVYPNAGIRERRWIPNDPEATTFTKPDLTVFEVNVYGYLYTIALAVQQFRRQSPGPNGIRGKIVAVSSVSGIVPIPTQPVYTSTKGAVTTFVRNYGKYLPTEKITLNAICPHVVRTNNEEPEFYDNIAKLGLLTPLEGIVNTFEMLLDDDVTSGECFEVGPSYHKMGALKLKTGEIQDKASERLLSVITEGSADLQAPQR